MDQLNSILALLGLGGVAALFYYVKGLQTKVSDKDSEISKLKVDSEVRVNEERVKEFGKKALNSLEIYRKLRGKRDGK